MMLFSKTPRVLGFVTMRAATSSLTMCSSAPTSSTPVSLDLMFSTAYPAMAAVAGLIPGREAGEMADGFDFTDFRKAFDLAADILRAEGFGGVDGRDVEIGKLVGFLAGRAPLEEQRLVLRKVTADFRNHASTSVAAGS